MPRFPKNPADVEKEALSVDELIDFIGTQLDELKAAIQGSALADRPKPQ